MSTNGYKRLMEVLKRWPLDKTKGTRDYGLYLRNLAKNATPASEIFSGKEHEKSAKFDALMRLADNKYQKKYASNRVVAATGLTRSQLHVFLSEEVVKKHFSGNVKWWHRFKFW